MDAARRKRGSALRGRSLSQLTTAEIVKRVLIVHFHPALKHQLSAFPLNIR